MLNQLQNHETLKKSVGHRLLVCEKGGKAPISDRGGRRLTTGGMRPSGKSGSGAAPPLSLADGFRSGSAWQDDVRSDDVSFGKGNSYLGVHNRLRRDIAPSRSTGRERVDRRVE